MGPIVVATDFTETSEPATRVALGLARAAGASVHLVHAWQPTSVVAMDAELLSPPEELTRITNERQAAMRALLTQFGEPGVSLTGHLVEGDPATEIARYARDHGASLIVMGTTAPTGLRAVLLGSVADQIVRVAPCPVLVVRAGPPSEEI